jgi:hypothetical protein
VPAARFNLMSEAYRPVVKGASANELSDYESGEGIRNAFHYLPLLPVQARSWHPRTVAACDRAPSHPGASGRKSGRKHWAQIQVERVMTTLETVWSRIEAHAEEVFRQIRGGIFTFDVRSGAIWPDRTNKAILSQTLGGRWSLCRSVAPWR